MACSSNVLVLKVHADTGTRVDQVRPDWYFKGFAAKSTFDAALVVAHRMLHRVFHGPLDNSLKPIDFTRTVGLLTCPAQSNGISKVRRGTIRKNARLIPKFFLKICSKELLKHG